MKFSIVSHACMTATDGKKTLVVDPWLAEPAYWGAWWHCPQPQFDDALFDADFIYITHWHFDHFDTKTLKRFRRQPTVLLPKFPVSSLAPLVHATGLSNVVELDHGQTFEVSPQFSLTSYQAALQDDSVAVVRLGDTTIVNLNDAKPLPSGWRRIKRDFPTVDVMLRSHSPAWSYPTRYSFEDDADRIVLDERSYMEAFVGAAKTVAPRYAVPFASGICHLHREVIDDNRFLVSADRLKAFAQSGDRLDPRTEIVIMPPGSSWEDGAFALAAPRGGEDPVSYARQRASEEAERLQKIYDSEAKRGVRYEEFASYFGRLARALGPAKLALRGVVWSFPIDGSPVEHWSYDFGTGKTARSLERRENYTVELTVTPAVLSAALRNAVFSNIDVSKRWRVYVRRGGLVKHLLACTALSLFEAGFFSLRNVVSWRFLRGYWKRLPEIGDYARMALGLVTKGPSSVRDVAGLAEG